MSPGILFSFFEDLLIYVSPNWNQIKGFQDWIFTESLNLLFFDTFVSTFNCTKTISVTPNATIIWYYNKKFYGPVMKLKNLLDVQFILWGAIKIVPILWGIIKIVLKMILCRRHHFDLEFKPMRPFQTSIVFVNVQRFSSVGRIR